MRKLIKLFLIVMIIHVALSGIINIQHNSNVLTIKDSNIDVKKQSQKNYVEINSPIIFKFGTIKVPKKLCTENIHGLAYKQLTFLYPKYKNCELNSCSYTVYGPSRIYTFDLLDGEKSVKLLSSVQNTPEDNEEQNKQTVKESVKENTEQTVKESVEQTIKVETEQTVKEEKISKVVSKKPKQQDKAPKQNQGYKVIKLSRAYQIPRVVIAIKNVIRSNWIQIRSAPLVRCLQKWQKDSYNFKLYFESINKPFQYTHVSKFQSQNDQIQGEVNIVGDKQISNLRIQDNSNVKITIKSQKPTKVTIESKDQQFLSRTQPIFTVKSVTNYNSYSIVDFKNHPGYIKVVQRCNQHFGRFDLKWVTKIQYKQDNESKVHYFQLVINFIPFLVQVDLEAHYYGSTEKASILQIDEKVFSGKQGQKYFDNWTQIKQFQSYKAFRDTNQYVLSQFTYLRFYKVIAAYSSLYKNGRYVRLVYQSQNNYFTFTPNGQNQFNILVYIIDGKYYIDRNDFHATNTYSFGRNDWVALFSKLDNLDTHQDYHRIVKYFKNEHFQFTNVHQVDQVRFKDNLYIVKFRNPTNITKSDIKTNYAVIKVTKTKIKIINHFNWTLLNDKSIQKSKAEQFIKQKYNSSVILFVHFTTSRYGKHYQISYLNSTKHFSNAYLRFVEEQQLFTEDQWQGIAYQIDFDEVPLPKNPEQDIIKFVISQDKGITIVVQIKNINKNTYECVTLTSGQRWKLHINWVKGTWVISNKQAIKDGYYFVTGYPSINVASCTGYLAKIYPTVFSVKWVYSSIEVKNIGYFIYNRIIFKLGTSFFQGVIRSTHGVQNSHTLMSWDKVVFGVDKQDYGYGITYSWNYGYNKKYFFDFNDQVTIVSKSTVTLTITQKLKSNDLLCTYWDGNNCLACSGDYYADNGKCVKVEQECQFWNKTGNCERCQLGYKVDQHGKCATELLVITKAQ